MVNNDDTYNLLKNNEKFNTKQENVKCDDIKNLQDEYNYLFFKNAKLKAILRECKIYLEIHKKDNYSKNLLNFVKDVLNDNK